MMIRDFFPRLQISRRLVLGGLAGSAAIAAFPPLSLAANPRILRAAPGRQNLDDKGGPTSVWAYGGTVPGPVIRAKQRARIDVRLENGLEQPTSIHWHGIRIENAMDGVAGMTQDPVPPGGTFDYSFIVPDAGTYWYHPHFRSWEQLARGLYGVLIVDETDPPDVDADLLFVADDWRLSADNQVDEKSFGSLRDWSHGGRLGNWLTINGMSGTSYEVRPGARVRLRCVNVANARILAFDFGALSKRIVAMDGQPLVEPTDPKTALILAPGQRADLIIDIPSDGPKSLPIREVSNSEPVEAARLLLTGATISKPRSAIAEIKLAPNPVPSNLDLQNAVTVELRMGGGAMGQMAGATYKGQYYGIRELVGFNQAWAFNGVSGRTDKPLVAVAKNRTVTIDMINETRWPHAMHLHGHHFKMIARNGTSVLSAPWRDTELVGVGERVKIAFVADNPGKWMFHCHMLEHQAAGMVTWLQVANS